MAGDYSIAGSLDFVIDRIRTYYVEKDRSSTLTKVTVTEVNLWTSAHSTRFIDAYWSLMRTHTSWVNVYIHFLDRPPKDPNSIAMLMDAIEHLTLKCLEDHLYYNHGKRYDGGFVQQIQFSSLESCALLIPALVRDYQEKNPSEDRIAIMLRRRLNRLIVNRISTPTHRPYVPAPEAVLDFVRDHIRAHSHTLQMLEIQAFSIDETIRMLGASSSSSGAGAGAGAGGVRIPTLYIIPRDVRPTPSLEQSVHTLYDIVASTASDALTIRMDLLPDSSSRHLLPLTPALHLAGLRTLHAKWFHPITQGEMDTFMDEIGKLRGLRYLSVSEPHRYVGMGICTRRYMDLGLLTHPTLATFTCSGMRSRLISDSTAPQRRPYTRRELSVILTLACGLETNRPCMNGPYVRLPIELLRKARDTLGYVLYSSDMMSCGVCSTEDMITSRDFNM